ARAVSAERLLVETDAPDQTPLQHRPAANEPAFLSTVIAELAALRGESAEYVAELTDSNARRLFRL
ncbi:MAG: TatD family hydrolase, partial [Polyangiaceae bacterium]